MERNQMKSQKLITEKKLIDEFKNYLVEELGFLDDMADEYSKEIRNPYDCLWVLSEYDSCETIDGIEYEVFSCHTDFLYCGIFDYIDKPPFEFYMLIDLKTLPDHTVGAYSRSRKKFIVKEQNG